MQTKMNDLIPMLICRDVQKSIRFYCDVLGFEIIERIDDIGTSGWASLKNGQARIMLASPSYFPEPKKSEGRYPQAVYYFYPADVKQLYSSIQSKGYEVSDLTVRFYGMREFEMLDPDGHILTFGQDSGETSASDKS